MLIAGGLSDIDQPEEADITVDLSILGGATTSHTFKASIICRPHRPCDLWRKRDWYVPSTLPLINYQEESYISGTVVNPTSESWEDIWYVPFRFYRLTKIQLFSWTDSASGFEVTYSTPDDGTGRFKNWPDQVHTFGTRDGTDEP